MEQAAAVVTAKSQNKMLKLIESRTERDGERKSEREGERAEQSQLKGATQTTSRVSNLFRQINHTIERQKIK